MSGRKPFDQSDFYAAIQAVMAAAHASGWDLDKVYDYATDAADEWLGQMETDEFDGDAFDGESA